MAVRCGFESRLLLQSHAAAKCTDGDFCITKIKPMSVNHCLLSHRYV